MIEVENFIYRYRSLEKIFKFNELENLEIYFSKPSELNDQMENYMNIIWQGDEIAFKGLFKHYRRPQLVYTVSRNPQGSRRVGKSRKGFAEFRKGGAGQNLYVPEGLGHVPEFLQADYRVRRQ